MSFQLPGTSFGANRYENTVQLVHTAYNVVMFISWPDNVFNGTEAPFTFCSLSDPLLGEVLKQYVDGRYLGDRKSTHMHLDDSEKADSCHVVLMVSENEDQLRDVLKAGGDGVLTISDTESFPRSGGMVGIVNEKDHSRLFVNHQAIRKAHLRISSNLLNIATIVDK